MENETIQLPSTNLNNSQPITNNNNRNWVWLLVTLVSTVVLATCIWLGIGLIKSPTQLNETVENQPTPYPLAGQLALLTGDVQVKSDLNDFSPATMNMTVREGDTIKTGSESRAVVELDDGSALRLNENTQLTLSKLTSQHFTLNQSQGEIYHRVEPNPDRPYQVICSDVTITALGTAFNVITNPEKEVEVQVIENQVKVEYTNTEKVVNNNEELRISIEEEHISDKKSIDAETMTQDWYAYNRDKDREEGKTGGVWSDTAAPTLTISEPVNNFETANDKIKIKGQVEATATLKIRVGEAWEIVNHSANQYEHEVQLQAGENKYQLKAYSPAGKNTEREVTIKRTTTTNTPSPSPTVKPTSKPTEKPSSTPKPTEAAQFLKIKTLTSPESGKVKVAWEMEGYEQKAGYKIVFSKNANPEYPNRDGDHYYYVSDNDTHEVEFEDAALSEGGTFHFRVCRYWAGEDGKNCDIYSADKSVEVGSVNWGTPTISLTTQQEDRTISTTWTIENGSAPQGFKVVWSKTENPTYPQANSLIKQWSLLPFVQKVWATETEETQDEKLVWGYEYLSNPSSRSATIELDASHYDPGTWYMRVCRYRDGSCDIYSNQVSFVLH